jgi:DNA-binding transcriptional LysR family regulator
MAEPLDIAALEDLLPWATETQKKYVAAVKENGSGRAAAKALGVDPSSVRESLRGLRDRAARLGHAPGHFSNGVAPGYLMGKVTVHRDKGGEIVQTWERQSPDRERVLQAVQEAVQALLSDTPRYNAIPMAHEVVCRPELLNLYTLTDSHVGMLAWHCEGGANWDMEIAEKVLTDCFMHALWKAPDASVAVINQLGDFLHWDGLLAVTPTSGHVLDADGRFTKLVRVSVRILRRLIDAALRKHEEVIVILAEGNHDMASSIWLRELFSALYENEPRVNVVTTELPYYAIEHGETMLAFHHGHLKKPADFPLVFAAQYPEVWGRTKKRYAHAGHQHHLDKKEHGGMIVTQHPTLAARDAYAARGAWFAERALYVPTYHSTFGQVAETTITGDGPMTHEIWSRLTPSDLKLAHTILQHRLGPRTRLLPDPDLIIAPDGRPYIYRWWVIPRNDRANVYFHIQVLDDPDRPMHDHPWDNTSVVLSGGYYERYARIRGEEHVYSERLVAPGQVVHRPASELHHLKLRSFCDYSMSLFTTGPKVREWGFFVPNRGWVSHKELIRDLPDGRSVYTGDK